MFDGYLASGLDPEVELEIVVLQLVLVLMHLPKWLFNLLHGLDGIFFSEVGSEEDLKFPQLLGSVGNGVEEVPKNIFIDPDVGLRSLIET